MNECLIVKQSAVIMTIICDALSFYAFIRHPESSFRSALLVMFPESPTSHLGLKVGERDPHVRVVARRYDLECHCKSFPLLFNEMIAESC